MVNSDDYPTNGSASRGYASGGEFCLEHLEIQKLSADNCPIRFSPNRGIH
jgi:hypothetical protein